MDSYMTVGGKQIKIGSWILLWTKDRCGCAFVFDSDVDITTPKKMMCSGVTLIRE